MKKITILVYFMLVSMMVMPLMSSRITAASHQNTSSLVNNYSKNDTVPQNNLQALTTGSLSGFISTWNTSNPGVSNSNTISLPLVSSGTYNFTVAWGDGSSGNVTSYNSVNVTHTYTSAGVYNVTITGNITGWEFNNGGDVQKITDIVNWGPLQLGNTGYYFYGATNLAITATDPLNLNGTTTFAYAFANDSSLTTGNLNNWNTSLITSTTYMFNNDRAFNMSINNWDVTKTTDMSYMLTNDTSFSQDLGSWYIGSVTTFTGFLLGGKLSVSNYDSLLINWSHHAHMNVAHFDAGSSVYSSAASAAWNSLVLNNYWNIFDGGQVQAPSTPQSSLASAGTTYVNVTWSAPTSDGGTPVTNYLVYRSITNGSGYSLLATVSASILSYIDTSIVNGTTYFYVVMASNSYLNSSYSIVVSATPQFFAPSAPQTVHAVTTGNYVNVTWTAPSSAGSSTETNYTIYRSTTSGSGYSFLATVSASILSFIDTSVVNGTTYYYIVKTSNTYATSTFSSEASATPISLTSATSNTTTTTVITVISTVTQVSSSSSSSSFTNSNTSSNTKASPGFELLTLFSLMTTLAFFSRRKRNHN